MTKPGRDEKLGKLVDSRDNIFINHSRLHNCDSEAKEIYSCETGAWRNAKSYQSGILL